MAAPGAKLGGSDLKWCGGVRPTIINFMAKYGVFLNRGALRAY